MSTTPMIAIAYRFLISDRDRHGNVRYYVRRNPHRTLMRFAHDRPRCVGTN